jgi:hypothetical protein
MGLRMKLVQEPPKLVKMIDRPLHSRPTELNELVMKSE